VGVQRGADRRRGLEAVPYNVKIRSVRSRSGGALHLLVTFERSRGSTPPGASLTRDRPGNGSRDQLGHLEVELAYTKEACRRPSRSSRRATKSCRPPRRATDVERGAPEYERRLQSGNEELYTVNAEYQSKITELTELANDMITSCRAPKSGRIFLDAQLRIASSRRASRELQPGPRTTSAGPSTPSRIPSITPN